MVSGANAEPWLPFNFFFNILHLQPLNNWLLVTNSSNPFYLHQGENDHLSLFLPHGTEIITMLGFVQCSTLMLNRWKFGATPILKLNIRTLDQMHHYGDIFHLALNVNSIIGRQLTICCFGKLLDYMIYL